MLNLYWYWVKTCESLETTPCISQSKNFVQLLIWVEVIQRGWERIISRLCCFCFFSENFIKLIKAESTENWTSSAYSSAIVFSSRIETHKKWNRYAKLLHLHVIIRENEWRSHELPTDIRKVPSKKNTNFHLEKVYEPLCRIMSIKSEKKLVFFLIERQFQFIFDEWVGEIFITIKKYL